MLQFAFGEMGMSPKEFYGMSMFEYRCKVKGHMRREAKEWDRVRTLGFFIFKSVGDKQSKTPADIMKLPLLDGHINEHTIRPSLMKKLLEAKRKANGEQSGDTRIQDSGRS